MEEKEEKKNKINIMHDFVLRQCVLCVFVGIVSMYWLVDSENMKMHFSFLLFSSPQTLLMLLFLCSPFILLVSYNHIQYNDEICAFVCDVVMESLRVKMFDCCAQAVFSSLFFRAHIEQNALLKLMSLFPNATWTK